MSCQVLIQLLAPDLACLNKSQQRLATIVEATAQLASNNISVCISLDAATDDRVMSLEDLNKLAPILQQLDTNLWKKQYDEAVILSSWKPFAEDDNDAPAHPWDPCSSLKRAGIPSFQQIVTASHVSALLPARNSIKSLSLYGVFPLALLAKFGNLQRLELHSLDADGQNHLSALRRLVELHLTFPDRGPCSMALGSVLDSNSDSLLHVVLTAKSWDDETYAYPSVETMQHLTSLKLVGMHLVGARFQPQLKLQVLTISGGCMGNTQLAQIVQSYPSLKQVNLISMLAHCLHRLAPATPRYSLSE